MTAKVPSDESCSNCSAWIVSDQDSSVGQCRRHAPAVILTGRFESAGGVGTTMTAPPPDTDSDYWCFEWTGK